MELSKLEILAQLDAIECEIHSQYRRIQGLRGTLRAQWRITNAPGYWPDETGSRQAVVVSVAPNSDDAPAPPAPF